MQALILAAGRGSRLGQQTADMPKCLLQVGNKPLIDHQLECLAEAGIGPVGMVVGYGADRIKEKVGIQAEYVESPRWEDTNSLYSFWLAREWVKGPVVVLNCDLLFHPEILNRLLTARENALAYDSTSGHGREHMKVRTVDGHLGKLSKTLSSDEVDGENVGILSFTERTAQHLFAEAGTLIRGGGEKLWLASAVDRLSAGHRIRTVDVAGLPWGEIDFGYDLHQARKKVWPAIQQVNGFSGSSSGKKMNTLPLTFDRRWTTVSVEGLSRAEARVEGERVANSWWVLEDPHCGEFCVTGPTSVRLESRLLAPAGRHCRHPYVLELRMDGERLDWVKKEATQSSTWSNSRWSVGTNQRIDLEIPAGTHRLGVRLLASDSGLCVVRVKREARRGGNGTTTGGGGNGSGNGSARLEHD